MKNSIKIITATALLTILFSSYSNAQEISAGTSSENKSAINNTSSTSAAIVAANPDVVTKFTTLFPAAIKQLWAVNGNCFFVSFLNDGRKASASFTKKGKMNYVITDCTKQLPESIQKAIPVEYISYTVNNAIEIKVNDTVAYQVILENESIYTTLKFTSDGVEKTQQVKKINK